MSRKTVASASAGKSWSPVQRIDTLAVIGVGLIGGSFALALKAAGAVGRVIGVGRDPANIRRALDRGAIDTAQLDAGAAVDGADFVLVSAPVGAMPAIFERIALRLAPDTVVTDGGSTKMDVIGAARAALDEKIFHFVPGHPIAGSDESGAVAASASLYRGKEVVLTPLPENQAGMIERVRAAWQACGARVTEMAPAEHDAALAVVSHLPHLLSFALMHGIAQRADARGLLAHAGVGFRDFTRLAASNPEMWRDICLANRAALLGELRRYQDELALLGAMLEQGDAKALQRALEEARAARRAWAAQRGGPGVVD
ncbi:MAG TPA: prephenate dehydrogenase/arogenate dehydrogenase family protein [Burkholderiales bacterium]|nr:prephenate dehydrogenase/arogenate dehydrogenase family protein [Burkholderiales bacterium]